MIRVKNKKRINILFREQLTSIAYFVSLFLIYTILFELASLSFLIETLKYLWPLLIVGGLLVLVNLWRTWLILRK